MRRLIALLALSAGVFSAAPARAQVTSNDPNFTPSLLKSGFTFPDGVVFRPASGDLLVSQENQISIVNATSGATSTFVTYPSGTFLDKVSIRLSDGTVAVLTSSIGPIDFYNSTGSLQGSISQSSIGNADLGLILPGTTVCLGGPVFDTHGNLFVAAGPAGETGCSASSWAIYEFAGPTPWTATPTLVTTFGALSVVIQDMAYSAARPPFGTLYAIDSQGANVYEISLTPVCDGEICETSFPANISAISNGVNPRGIAIDPLLGDIYVTEFQGTQVLRIPAPGITSDPAPTTFATGFSNNESGNTLRLGFDTNGNLYINESTAGNLWKFTRNSFATAPKPLVSGQINTLAFTNPNPAMADQTQTIMIPASANLNGAAFIQDIFVPTDPNTLNTTLQNGTTGDVPFFGGAPVPAGTKCVLVPSASPSPTSPSECLVIIQKCYDANHNPFDICPVQVPATSPDLIQLTTNFNGAPASSAFLIGFDNGDGQDITDITILDCTGCTGGTKSLCSKTFQATLPANLATPDFSLTASPNSVNLGTSNSGSATVIATSLNGFASTIRLSASDVPLGLSASLTPTSVPLSANGTASSTLTVSTATNATTPGIISIVSNLLATGCIDNAGVANALTSKLSAAQAAISGGQIQTAINVLTAFKSQVQAQSGKHISASCTTAFPLVIVGTAVTDEARLTSVNVTFTPANVLTSVVSGLINTLKTSLTTADPITGFVTNSGGVGVQGVTVTLNGSTSPIAAVTDATGFYYFATTGTLNIGSSYVLQVTAFPTGSGLTTSTPTQQSFTWGGKGLAFNFTVQ